jgi:glutaredoxin
MVQVTFYTKAGCWLCDSTEEMLNGLMERHGLNIERREIDSDPELYELYRFDVPVLEFRDGRTLHGRIQRKDLLRCIHENQE